MPRSLDEMLVSLRTAAEELGERLQTLWRSL